MSAPRYRITLDLGHTRITLKLKTVLGQHHELQREIADLALDGAFVRLARGLEEKYGGRDELQRLWESRALDGRSRRGGR